MATITGMTAAAMQAIRDDMIVSAAFDSANHLILTKYDGTQIDAGIVGEATTTASGLVELASNAEVLAGLDAVRAVTPAGLASIPGDKVQQIPTGTVSESAVNTAYPDGISTMYLTTGSGWSIASGFGTVLTVNLDADRCHQIFYVRAGGPTGLPRMWTRSHHSTDGGGGWSVWHQITIPGILVAGSFTQATAFTSYPPGQSRLYYTSSGTGWDFSGTAGEVTTYVNGTDFARQTFTSHVGGSSNKPARWFRTANATSGWTPWQIISSDSAAWTSYTPTWTAGTTNPSLGNGTLIGRYTRSGRTITCHINLTIGSTTTFGSGNYSFLLPSRSADVGCSFIGHAHLLSGTSRWGGQFVISPDATTGAPFMSTGTSNAQLGWMSQGSPVTLTSAHTLRMTFTYESAS